MAENILQSLMDKGLLSENVQEKLLNLIPENSREKLSGLFQRYQQLDEQEKNELLNQLVGRFKQTLHNNMYNEASLFERLLYSNSYTIFFFALLFVILILVFFVYKLFKCLSERQIKREEKKKIKQMKKKK
ncbi:uncharacterized protein LOC114879543 isoform X2 [Osmia bicornis bicornis]|uniref:uncharacterized protein LOC114879543 isoform X2 n=1 Tax=Osmia bicornis bicornis TaxID=1437191 RepID=UPI0010F9B31B|nr:uncharacterized protein LOC114879543 isoform X2 [Osmia bicornis bicornis]